MNAGKAVSVGFFVFACFCTAFAADVILNEYNAVGNGLFLNGGNSSADEDGGRAGDCYFGRVAGNGGDWFEMVVITDHLDMRGWRLDLYEGGAYSETLTFTSNAIWSDIRSGTIITVSEDVPSDVNYNPAAGDWWLNVQANGNASGAYITASNFAVSSDSWQLRIRDSSGVVRYGPAGEGVAPASGIGDTEVCKLKADPDATIVPASTDYDDGKDLSTFGAPNLWGSQNFNLLRSVAILPSTLTLITPNGGGVLGSGDIYTITWQNTGTVGNVTIEFSVNNGQTWTAVYPLNTGNTGSYDWLVPVADSTQCLVRVVNTANSGVFDQSNAFFTIDYCPLEGDINGDCTVDFYDFAELASQWLQSAD